MATWEEQKQEYYQKLKDSGLPDADAAKYASAAADMVYHLGYSPAETIQKVQVTVGGKYMGAAIEETKAKNPGISTQEAWEAMGKPSHMEYIPKTTNSSTPKVTTTTSTSAPKTTSTTTTQAGTASTTTGASNPEAAPAGLGPMWLAASVTAISALGLLGVVYLQSPRQ